MRRNTQVESGEGIESAPLLIARFDAHAWNPVKELKDLIADHLLPPCTPGDVESGEGIERI